MPGERELRDIALGTTIPNEDPPPTSADMERAREAVKRLRANREAIRQRGVTVDVVTLIRDVRDEAQDR